MTQTVLLYWSEASQRPPIEHRIKLEPLPASIDLPILKRNGQGDIGPARFLLTAEVDVKGRPIYREEQ